MFGETEITIHGVQFKQAEKIEVCFKTGKTEVISPGTFVDATRITCATPNFEEFGAVEVEVRLNINNEGWTVNKMRFRYFANTAAKNCLAFGPGDQREDRAARRGNSVPHPSQGHVQRQAHLGGGRVHRRGHQGGRPARAEGHCPPCGPGQRSCTRCTTRSPLRGGIASTSDTTISASRRRSFPSAALPFTMDFEDPWTYQARVRGGAGQAQSGARSHRFLRRRWRSSAAATTASACSPPAPTAGPGTPRRPTASPRRASSTGRLALREDRSSSAAPRSAARRWTTSRRSRLRAPRAPGRQWRASSPTAR